MDLVEPVQSVIPGAQGKVLAVLAETTAALSIRAIARLAGVSVAQASRVLPRLHELGLVTRRDVPPTALFKLDRDHIAARPLLELARFRDILLEEMGTAAAALGVVPTSVIVFGSLARGEADRASDIDAVLVRPSEFDEHDDRGTAAIDSWRDTVRRMSGNAVDTLEVGEKDVAARLRSKDGVWHDINQVGVVVHGAGLAELRGRAHA